MTSQAIYATKKVSIEEALSHIRSGDCIGGSTYAGEPVQIHSHH